MTAPEIPPGSAIVTPNEMLREIQATHQEVRDLRGLVESVVKPVADHEGRIRELEQQPDNTEVVGEVQDHETRLRALEQWRWSVAGLAAVLGGGGGALITKLMGG